MKNRKLHVSDDALRFIEHFEGYYATPYNDPANHATVGIGHLLHYGPVTQADRNKWNLSKREALDLLKKDIVKYEDAVKRTTPRGHREHQRQDPPVGPLPRLRWWWAEGLPRQRGSGGVELVCPPSLSAEGLGHASIQRAELCLSEL